MLKIDDELKKKFRETAAAFRLRLSKVPSKDTLRRAIAEKGIGKFYQCSKLDERKLSQIVEFGGVVGVDGSTNNAGGTFPYTITLQQALAKSCDGQDRQVRVTDALSPLIIEDTIDEDEYREMVKRNLACIEVKAALEAVEKFKPRIMLLDGSLVRYKIEASSLWEELKKKALAKDVVLVGVVEGISTGIICQSLKDYISEMAYPASDWELLFDLLKLGELLEISPGLFKEGFRTCFMRTSMDPKPVGIDLIEEQQGFLHEVGNLILTLTPRDGRGIPLWLDIIDKDVRISDAVIDGLLSCYMGEDYAEFIKSKREKRQW